MIDELLGVTLHDVKRVKDQEGEEIHFEAKDGRVWRMYHQQDCCESVEIEDIAGDLKDLTHAPILIAEEISSVSQGSATTGTWTFYKLATLKGYVTIRWGADESYYSTEVDFELVEK